MDYYVHVDLYDAVGPAVHKEACRCVRHRRPGALTTRWDGPLPRPEARRAALRAARARGFPVRDAPRCCGGLLLAT